VSLPQGHSSEEWSGWGWWGGRIGMPRGRAGFKKA